MNAKFSFLDYMSKAGPTWGGFGGLCYSIAYLLYFVKNHDLSDLAQVFFGLAFAASVYGIGRSIKRSTDIMVASEAEKRLDPNTANTSSSIVPQINEAIQSQRADAVGGGRETR